MILWVIGSGGLFGSAVVRAAAAKGWKVFTANPLPWTHPSEIAPLLQWEARRFVDSLPMEEPWAIVWGAGRVTTASSEEEALTELLTFRDCIATLRDQMQGVPRGRFLLASSAGGIYAGSVNPPFHSESQEVPLGVYGHLKREQEIFVAETLTDTMNVVIARLANLYGAGQDLAKLQGLISRLALASITKETLTMFVPQDTLRDYIYVDDAAGLTLHWLSVASEPLQTRVLATGKAASLGSIITAMKSITRTHIPIAFGLHPSAAFQAQDLRLIPDQDQWTQGMNWTPLPAGMKEVYLDVLFRHQQHQTGAA